MRVLEGEELEQVSGGWTLAELVAGYTDYDRWPIIPVGVAADSYSSSVDTSALNAGLQDGRHFSVAY